MTGDGRHNQKELVFMSNVAVAKRARITFAEDSSNWIEGEILKETESLIVISDEMYGECRMVKNNGIFITYLPCQTKN